MSSSYSSVDWVLSHWDHFTVRIFICVYAHFVCFYFLLHSRCIIVSMVGWTWWDWSNP